MVRRLSHILIEIVLLCTLSACATIELQPNIMLQNKEGVSDYLPFRHSATYEIPLTFDGNTHVALESPAIRIFPDLERNQVNASSEVIGFGPGFLLPLPIIPWIPGIVNAFTVSKPPTFLNTKVRIIVSFTKKGSQKEVLKYLMVPAKVVLKSGGTIYHPVSWSAYKRGVIGPRSIESLSAESQSFQLNDQLSFTMNPGFSSGFYDVEVALTFDTTYQSLLSAQEAVLDIGEIFVNYESVQIPQTILKFEKGLMLFWLFTINS